MPRDHRGAVGAIFAVDVRDAARRLFAFPGLTAAIAGLAVAAASATLLNLFHPFDAAVVDLLVHAFAVALVVVVSRVYGARLWALPNFSKAA